MTYPDEFTNDVNEWFTSHGPVDCTHLNGKTELIATYKRHYPEKSDKQADKAVKRAVRTVRGIIAPECTTAGLKRREVGADTSEHPSEAKVRNLVHNPIQNPIRNPIENARKKVKLAADNRAVLENNPFTADYILSPEQLEREVQTIIGTEYAELGGLTLKEALESKTYAVYVCACLCLYVSMSLCLCVSVSLCLCVSVFLLHAQLTPPPPQRLTPECTRKSQVRRHYSSSTQRRILGFPDNKGGARSKRLQYRR